MNKKVSTAIISIVCLGLMGAVTVGILYKNGIITSDNLYMTQNTTQPHTQGKAAQGVSSVAASDAQTKYRCPGVLLKEGAAYTLRYSEGKTVADTKYYDIMYKVNNIEITKKRGDFDICDDGDEKKDSLGNITNDYSYVVVNLTILDKCEKDDIFGLNGIGLFLGKEAMDGGELRAYNSKGRDIKGDKEYFSLSLKPNQKYDFNLAYIVKDDAIEKYKNDMMVRCYGDHGRRPPSNQDLPLVDSEGNITTLKEESGS